jgi:hypothetical protein
MIELLQIYYTENRKNRQKRKSVWWFIAVTIKLRTSRLAAAHHGWFRADRATLLRSEANRLS